MASSSDFKVTRKRRKKRSLQAKAKNKTFFKFASLADLQHCTKNIFLKPGTFCHPRTPQQFYRDSAAAEPAQILGNRCLTVWTQKLKHCSIFCLSWTRLSARTFAKIKQPETSYAWVHRAAERGIVKPRLTLNKCSEQPPRHITFLEP